MKDGRLNEEDTRLYQQLEGAFRMDDVQYERVLMQVQTGVQHRKSNRMKLVIQWASAVACMVLLLTGGWWMMQRRPPQDILMPDSGSVDIAEQTLPTETTMSLQTETTCTTSESTSVSQSTTSFSMTTESSISQSSTMETSAPATDSTTTPSSTGHTTSISTTTTITTTASTTKSTTTTTTTTTTITTTITSTTITTTTIVATTQSPPISTELPDDEESAHTFGVCSEWTWKTADTLLLRIYANRSVEIGGMSCGLQLGGVPVTLDNLECGLVMPERGSTESNISPKTDEAGNPVTTITFIAVADRNFQIAAGGTLFTVEVTIPADTPSGSKLTLQFGHTTKHIAAWIGEDRETYATDLTDSLSSFVIP